MATEQVLIGKLGLNFVKVMENHRSSKGLHRQLMVASLCLIAVSLCGCMSDNSRRTQFNHVAARAKLDKGVASYHEIEVAEPMDRKWFCFSSLNQA